MHLHRVVVTACRPSRFGPTAETTSLKGNRLLLTNRTRDTVEDHLAIMKCFYFSFIVFVFLAVNVSYGSASSSKVSKSPTISSAKLSESVAIESANKAAESKTSEGVKKAATKEATKKAAKVPAEKESGGKISGGGKMAKSGVMGGGKMSGGGKMGGGAKMSGAKTAAKAGCGGKMNRGNGAKCSSESTKPTTPGLLAGLKTTTSTPSDPLVCMTQSELDVYVLEKCGV